jgi:hypothetical protein
MSRRLALTAAATLAVVSCLAVPCLTASRPAEAAAAPARRVVVILLDRTQPATVGPAASIQGLAARGAGGLMTTTTADATGGESPFAPVATISAGAPAVGPDARRDPRMVQPGPPDGRTLQGNTAEVYRSRTGLEPTGAFVYPDIALLARLNADPTIAAAPGLLGETLRRAGIQAAVIGDSDLPGNPFRPGVILAMDQEGRVPSGALGTDLQRPGDVLPVTMDEKGLEEQTTSALGAARFLVVDWGDTSRVDRLERQMAERLRQRDQFGRTLGDRLATARTESLRSLDTYMTFLLKAVDLKKDAVLVVSPSPPHDIQERGFSVAPIFAAGRGVGHGAVSSDTTGRPGLVSNVDVAPMILSLFGLPVPDGMTGHPFVIDPKGFPVAGARMDLQRFGSARDSRRVVLTAAFLLWLIAVGVGVGVLESRLRTVGRQLEARKGAGSETPVPTLVRALALAPAFLPLSLLLLEPAAATGATWVKALSTVGPALVLGVVWSLVGRHRMAAGLGTVGALTTIALLFNLLIGSSLTDRSIAGAPAWTGRGLSDVGPVFSGAAVAGAILAAGALARRLRRQRTPRRLVHAAAGAALVVLGTPSLGGAVAVGPAGLTGVGVSALETEEDHPPALAWTIAGMTVGALLVVVAVLLLASAAARAAETPSALAPPTGTLAAFGAILLHAGGSALRSLLLGSWTPALVASIAVLGFVGIRFARGPWAEGHRGRGLPPADRFARSTMRAGVVASIAAFLTSPSGAGVAAVILMAVALLAVGSGLDRAHVERRRA